MPYINPSSYEDSYNYEIAISLDSIMVSQEGASSNVYLRLLYPSPWGTEGTAGDADDAIQEIIDALSTCSVISSISGRRFKTEIDILDITVT